MKGLISHLLKYIKKPEKKCRVSPSPRVYRTLEFLADNAFVRPSYSSNGHLTYEIAGNEHHHIICRNCGAEIEVEHTLLESLYRLLETTS